MKKVLIVFLCLMLILAAVLAGRWMVHERGNHVGSREATVDFGARQTTGDLEGAVIDYSAARHDPKDTYGFYNRAIAEQISGNLTEAIGNYNRTLGLDPKFAKAYNNRGAAKQGAGDLDGALADYNRAIGLDPKSARAYDNRGAVKQIKGDLGGAIADFTRAIDLDPKYAKAYNNRGNAKAVLGDMEGAAADHSRAREYIPKRAAPENSGTIQRRDITAAPSPTARQSQPR